MPQSPRSMSHSSQSAPHAGAHPRTAHPVDATPEEAAALRLWVTLSRAQSAISAHAAVDVARNGLTLAEFAILEALYHRGSMLLGEVQRRILVSSGGITFLVDRLTAKGLVERQECPSDRRARYASLTAKGEALIGSIFPAHAAALARAMGGLSPEEMRQTADLLRTLGRFAAELPPEAPEHDDEAATEPLDDSAPAAV